MSWFLMMGLIYQSLYNCSDMDESVYKLSLLSASATSSIRSPRVRRGRHGGFYQSCRARWTSAGKVTSHQHVDACSWITSAFLCVLTLGLIVLFRRNDLDPTEIIASASFSPSRQRSVFCSISARVRQMHWAMRWPGWRALSTASWIHLSIANISAKHAPMSSHMKWHRI